MRHISLGRLLAAIAVVTILADNCVTGQDPVPGSNQLAVDAEQARCDELELSNDLFVCESNHKCISKSLVCNRRPDCADNSDEALCDCFDNSDCVKNKGRGYACYKHVKKHLATSSCELCPKGKRFVHDQCEDVDECGSSQDVCIGNGSCLNYDGGFTCVRCPKGYEAHMHDFRYFAAANASTASVGVTPERRETLRHLFLCRDLNECELDNPCGAPTYCVNTVGSFRCECPLNHAPSTAPDDEESNDMAEGDEVDNVCRAIGGQPLIAIAENYSIGIYDLRSRVLNNMFSVDQPIVDIVAYKDVIFYAHRHQLWEYRLVTGFQSLIVDLHSEHEQLAFTSPPSIRRLAIDWENKRIYILTGDTITLVNFFGRGGTIISHRGTIASLAVDPVERYLFYSEQGSVFRVHLDGVSTPTKIFVAFNSVLYENVQRGEAMALDPNIRTIYYLHDHVLYSFDYQGGDSVVLRTEAPFARLEPFEDRLFANYRSDSSGLVSLHRTGYTFTQDPKAGHSQPPNGITFHGTRPRAMSVIHVAKFPESHKSTLPCFGPEVCRSGWCFPLPDPDAAGHRCVCSPGDAERNCVRVRLHSFKPKNPLVSSAEMNAAEAAYANVQYPLVVLTAVVTLVRARLFDSCQ